MDDLIRLQDICFAYPDSPAVLAGVDLNMVAGERVGLVGGIGCGKTTLLQLVVGLLMPSAGEIHAFGQPRRNEKDFHEVRRKAGLLFQDADDQLFCPTVAEDIAFGPVNLGHSRQQAHAIVHEVLDELDLNGFEDRITYKLSAGEKRLVALATVLAMRPQVLLLDEPTANLDGPHRRRLVEILSARSEAMLLVSHDQDLIRTLCTRVVCLAGGKVAASGPVEQILADTKLLRQLRIS